MSIYSCINEYTNVYICMYNDMFMYACWFGVYRLGCMVQGVKVGVQGSGCGVQGVESPASQRWRTQRPG